VATHRDFSFQQALSSRAKRAACPELVEGDLVFAFVFAVFFLKSAPERVRRRAANDQDLNRVTRDRLR
jgi:hypothetical protein